MCIVGVVKARILSFGGFDRTIETSCLSTYLGNEITSDERFKRGGVGRPRGREKSAIEEGNKSRFVHGRCGE